VDGFVFRGDDGLDELTTTTTSRVWSISEGEVSEHSFDPADLGITRADPAELVGGDVALNTAVVHRLLAGERGAVRDAVLLNAAAGIAAYDRSSGSIEDRLSSAMHRAAQAVDSGSARDTLARWLEAVAAP
jgi:anthranilate phosphoribosyltransferase